MEYGWGNTMITELADKTNGYSFGGKRKCGRCVTFRMGGMKYRCICITYCTCCIQVVQKVNWWRQHRGRFRKHLRRMAIKCATGRFITISGNWQNWGTLQRVCFMGMQKVTT